MISMKMIVVLLKISHNEINLRKTLEITSPSNQREISDKIQSLKSTEHFHNFSFFVAKISPNFHFEQFP